MPAIAFVTLLPILILSAGLTIILLAIAFYRSYGLTFWLTLATLGLSLISLPVASSSGVNQVTLLLNLNHFVYFYYGLITSAGILVALLSYGYVKSHQGNREEFYLLLLLATLGSEVLVASVHFVSFFLGLEILSVSLYALIGYDYNQINRIEAGIKYLVLAAVSAAFLLFGMALVYAQVGSMGFAQMAGALGLAGDVQSVYALIGAGLIVVGIGFKLAVVPFHMWTPDVYEGAPAPVTAFIATISKGSMFALLIRLFSPVDFKIQAGLFVIFSIIAILSILVGNLLALMQKNVKRILAYSSIAHLGYLFVAFLASGALAVTAATFYLVAYFVTTLGAFGIVTIFSSQERDLDDLSDYQGLFFQHPWLAALFTALLLSLAGIPLTAGFIGKFLLVSAGVGSTLWLLVIVLAIGSAIGLFYYLRVVITLFQRPKEAADGKILPARSLSIAGGVALAAITILLFWFGVYPAPLLQMIQTLTSAIG